MSCCCDESPAAFTIRQVGWPVAHRVTRSLHPPAAVMLTTCPWESCYTVNSCSTPPPLKPQKHTTVRDSIPSPAFGFQEGDVLVNHQPAGELTSDRYHVLQKSAQACPCWSSATVCTQIAWSIFNLLCANSIRVHRASCPAAVAVLRSLLQLQETTARAASLLDSNVSVGPHS